MFLFLLLCASVALENIAHAQLSLRTSTVVNGNYAMIGNALVDCPGGGTASCGNNRTALIAVDRDAVALGDRWGRNG